MNHFHVAAGILRDAVGRILITERLCDGPFNGLWEFPGGKIAAGETPAEALRRELAEELGITVAAAQPYMELRHEYPDRTVDLEFFLVTDWHGEPSGLEGQGIRWMSASEINPDVLLPADAPVIEQLRLTAAAAEKVLTGSKAQRSELPTSGTMHAGKELRSRGR